MIVLKRLLRKYYKKSYSQNGEDLIIDVLLEWLDIKRPTYLDIGAHHSKWLSNTFFFYKKGCTGVCIEPDPVLFKELKKARKKDVCLNVGIGTGLEETANFYVMTLKTLNTFSLQEAKVYMTYYDNCRIEKVIKMDVIHINDIICTYLKPHPNFLSIDVEGIDFEVLKSLDLTNYRPEVICVETIEHNADKSFAKATRIIDYMKSNEYIVYADTFINTIFVDKTTLLNKNITILDNH